MRFPVDKKYQEAALRKRGGRADRGLPPRVPMIESKYKQCDICGYMQSHTHWKSVTGYGLYGDVCVDCRKKLR